MLNVIMNRQSVRAWKPREVARQDVLEILVAAMQAPSALNEQAWQFVVVEGDMLISYQAINKNCPPGAPIGILVLADQEAEKFPGFALQDCCAATENMLLAIQAKGFGGLWTSIFSHNLEQTRKLLSLPERQIPVAFVPFGYPQNELKQPPSRYNENKVHWNTW